MENLHHEIIGSSGTGKSTLAKSLALDRLESPILFIDPLGHNALDFIDHLPLRVANRLCYIDLGDRNYSVGFNPIDEPQHVIPAFKAIWKDSWGPRLEIRLYYALAAVWEAKATLVDVARMFDDPERRSRILQKVKNPDALINQTKSQIAQRLYTIARMGTFNAMLSAPENKFDALKCMQERKIVLINTDSEHLDEASPVFGRFLIAQIMAAARRRPEHQRHLALLIIDEAKAYFDEKTEEILADARQFGLGLLFATQHIEQLPEGVRKAMYGNTSIKLVGEVGYGDAVALSREMNTTAEHLKGLVGLDIGRPAQWACHVSGLTKSALTLSVPYGTLENLPLMSTAELAALRKTNRDHFTATTNHSQHKEEPRDTPQPQAAPRATSASPIEYDTDI